MFMKIKAYAGDAHTRTQRLAGRADLYSIFSAPAEGLGQIVPVGEFDVQGDEAQVQRSPVLTDEETDRKKTKVQRR